MMKKRSKVGKNKKKSWRKTDASDIYDALHEDNVRKQIKAKIGDNIESLYEITTSTDAGMKDNEKYKKMDLYLQPDDEDCISESIRTKKMNTKYFHQSVAAVSLGAYANNEEPTSDLWSCNLSDSISNKKTKKLTKKKDQHCVHVPHSGMSYNPKTEDYEKYASGAVTLENDKEKKQIRLNTKYAKNQQKYKAFKNISDGFRVELVDRNNESDEDNLMLENINELGVSEISHKIIPNRLRSKSRKQKMKAKLRRIQSKNEKFMLYNKKLNVDFHQLKALSSKVDEEMKLLVDRSKDRQKQRALKDSRAHLQCVLPSVSDVPLPEELRGSVRVVKPTLNFLQNKFDYLKNIKMVSKSHKKSKRKAKKLIILDPESA